MKNREGWAIDVTNKNHTHYYKDGKSLCGRALDKEFFNGYDNSDTFSGILGYTCSICEKKKK